MIATNRPKIDPGQSAESLIKTIKIPPCPALLLDVQRELAHPDPEPARLAALIANDVALAASLLKLANSAFFGLRLQARSVVHAVNLLGMNQCAMLISGIILRQSLPSENHSLEKFWTTSTRRAHAMTRLAQRMRICSGDLAYTFGLFSDIGIPLLLDRFEDYAEVLELAYQSTQQKFTDFEEQRYMTSHAALGSLMARTWGLPEAITQGILLHHDYAVLEDGATEELVRALIALSLIAEYAIQKYQGTDYCNEWLKGGELACQFLGVSIDEVDDHVDEVIEVFNHV